MDHKKKQGGPHGSPSHVQSGATWDPLATASHQVGPNGDTTWGTSLAKNEESTLLRVITTMPFQSIPCCSTNPQLQVPLQDSQHCFIWSKVFCETDAQLTLQLISFHLAPVVGSSFLIHISTCLLHPVEFISNKVEMQLPSDISKKATWYMPYLMTFFLAYVSLSGIFLTFFLAFYLVYLRRFFVVEVQRGTLWSGARGWGPAGNALIQRLLLGSGGEHYDLQSVPELRTEPGVQKYGKIPYLLTPPDPDSARIRIRSIIKFPRSIIKLLRSIISGTSMIFTAYLYIYNLWNEDLMRI